MKRSFMVALGALMVMSPALAQEEPNRFDFGECLAVDRPHEPFHVAREMHLDLARRGFNLRARSRE